MHILTQYSYIFDLRLNKICNIMLFANLHVHLYKIHMRKKSGLGGIYIYFQMHKNSITFVKHKFFTSKKLSF